MLGISKALGQRFLGEARGERRQAGDLVGHLERALHQLGVRHQPLGEADAISLVGIDRVAQGGAHGVALADPARQAHRAAIGRHDTQPHLRQAPFGAFRRNDQIAAISSDAADAIA